MRPSAFHFDAPSSVQRDGFKLDVEAVAVGVRPRAADANPDLSAIALATAEVVAAFAVANIVGEVAGRPGSGSFGFD